MGKDPSQHTLGLKPPQEMQERVVEGGRAGADLKELGPRTHKGAQQSVSMGWEASPVSGRSGRQSQETVTNSTFA